MVHIRKTKLFSGELKYAVVDLHIAITKDANNEIVRREEYLPLEYSKGDKSFSAIFPLTEEGLAEAKEVQKLYKNRK